MQRLTSSDLADLARYPVSLQQTIAALWGVEQGSLAPAIPDTTPAQTRRQQDLKGSGK